MNGPRLKEEAYQKLVDRYVKRGWSTTTLERQLSAVKLYLYQFGIDGTSKKLVPSDMVYYHYSNSVIPERRIPRNMFTMLLGFFIDRKFVRGMYAFKIEPEKIGLSKEYSFYQDPRHLKVFTKGNINYYGVSREMFGDWLAEIEFEGKKWLIGYYDNPHEAAYAYNKCVKYFKLDLPKNVINNRNFKSDDKKKTIRDLKILINTKKTLLKRGRPRKQGKKEKETRKKGEVGES